MFEKKKTTEVQTWVKIGERGLEDGSKPSL